MTILIGLLAINIIILVHEWGHFLAARWLGVRVHEFSLGMGPLLVKRQHGHTQYSFRLLPVGGFVRVAGMGDEEPDDTPREALFTTQPKWGRALILVAGSGMNIIVATLMFIGLVMMVGVPAIDSTVQTVLPESPAARAGIKSGDRLVMLNDGPITDMQRDVIHVIRQSNGDPLRIVMDRQGSMETVTVIPNQQPGQPVSIGVQFAMRHDAVSWVQAIGHGIQMSGVSIGSTLQSIQLLIQRQVQVSDLIGPVGIVQLMGSQKMGGGLLMLMATISIALGVFNLLPLPILDGGHLMFLGLEAIRNKRLDPRIENRISQISMLLLMILMVLILGQDISQWSSRAMQLR